MLPPNGKGPEEDKCRQKHTAVRWLAYLRSDGLSRTLCHFPLYDQATSPTTATPKSNSGNSGLSSTPRPTSLTHLRVSAGRSHRTKLIRSESLRHQRRHFTRP